MLPLTPQQISRRSALKRLGDGFGFAAFTSMICHGSSSTGASEIDKDPDHRSAFKTTSAKRGTSLRPMPHHDAKARAVIQIFCPGGLSHVDTWNYRPELERQHGQPFDAEKGKLTFAGVGGNFAKSFWPFRQHGECGRWISDLFPKLSLHVDRLGFVHSMQNKSALHGPAMFMLNSGFIRPGFPSMGAWVAYGLGSENENLPAFVVLPDVRGLPPGGVLNWGAGFLPAIYQGTVFESSVEKPPIANLFPRTSIDADEETAARSFLSFLNQKHASTHPNEDLLDARIASYELAARLQLETPDAVDLRSESEVMHKLYAVDDPDIGPFGRQCLLARRLVERGVRFIQIFCGSENTGAKKIRPNWDSHEDIVRDHGYWGRILDTGASALLRDLSARGLLDSTLVICTSEFGRQPFMQGKQLGRDHNPGAFSAWMAGGGIKGGTAFGATDEFGLTATTSPVYSYDLHATALHLMGLNHERLTYYHNGIERRLTDVHGSVISDIIDT